MAALTASSSVRADERGERRMGFFGKDQPAQLPREVHHHHRGTFPTSLVDDVPKVVGQCPMALPGLMRGHLQRHGREALHIVAEV